MHEVFVGELEGRNDEPAIAEFRRVYDCWQSGDLEVAHPGGESGRDLLDRYLPAVAGLRDRHPDGGTLVLISHGAALRLAAQELVEHVGTPRRGGGARGQLRPRRPAAPRQRLGAGRLARRRPRRPALERRRHRLAM